MAATLADWETVQTNLMTDLKRQHYVGNYSVGQRQFSYRTLQELTDLIDYVDKKIASLTSTGNDIFQLGRFAPE